MIGSAFSTPIYKQFVETGDKGLFEHVIDDVILEKYSDDDNIKDFIKSLSSVDKRMSTLSLMSDDNVLWKKIYEIHRGNDTKYNKIKKIILLLRDYVKIADVERKSHGEILTPFNELAKPMVNLMDKYDEEFWKYSKNKVLDSSAGYGTFLILCLYKFMEGLKEFEPDEDKRLKHIIENQLYYGELQSKSVFSWLVAIDPNDEYDTNIYWGSYLDDGFDFHMKTVWNVEKFDLIIQNPPYQMQKVGFTKTQPIWHLFVDKSLNILKTDKYLIMVHPGDWRNIDGIFNDIKLKIKSKKVLYLEMHDKWEGEKIFGAATTFDFYILKNNINNNKTEIKSKDGISEFINISEMNFIPNGMFSEFNDIMAKEGEEKVNILYSRGMYGNDKNWMSKVQTDENIYPCIYYTYKGERLNIWYSSIINGHFNIPKVIWSNGSASTPIIDDTGQYGVMNFACSIVDDIDKLPLIKRAMESDKFCKLMSYSNGVCGVGGQRYNNKVIKNLKKKFWEKFI